MSNAVRRRLLAVVDDEAGRRRAAWTQLREELDPDGDDADLARLVLDAPEDHPWREVDAALERSICADCGAELGSGERGCRPCDLADGVRFVAREPDRPAVPPGNEHALRVALTLVRFPHRWPDGAVEGARLYLPYFAAGDLPTKSERYALLRALREGRADELADATGFAEMAARTGYL